MTQTTVKERPILFSGPMVRAILEGRKTQTRRVVKASPGEQAQWLTPDKLDMVPHGEMIDGGWQMHHPKAGQRWMGVDIEHDSPFGWVRCPYGRPGDRLYVKESLRLGDDGAWVYAADGAPVLLEKKHEGDMLVWAHHKEGESCQAAHMPRWASRLTLEVTGVRVERVQDITEADARAEGLFAQEGTGTGPGVGYKWRGTGYHGAEWGPDGGMLFHVPDHHAGGRCCCKAAGPTPVQCAYREAWDSLHAARGFGWDVNPWVWVVTFARLDTPPRA